MALRNYNTKIAVTDNSTSYLALCVILSEAKDLKNKAHRLRASPETRFANEFTAKKEKSGKCRREPKLSAGVVADEQGEAHDIDKACRQGHGQDVWECEAEPVPE